jgi:dTDP-4-dehydrorhamnose reductase
MSYFHRIESVAHLRENVNILLTGAEGLLGRTFVAHAHPSWNLCPQSHSDLDITDPEKLDRVVREYRPDAIINCAAYTDVDGAETNKSQAHTVNTEGAKHLAQVTHKHHVVLVHISTDFVFDGGTDRPYTEDNNPSPLSVYGHTKWQGEKEIEQYNPNHLIVRTAWLYGDDGNTFPQKLMDWAKQGEIRVAHDQTGSPTYAPHLVDGISTCLAHGAKGVIHLAGSGQTTRFQWAQTLFEALEMDVVVQPVPSSSFKTAATRPQYSALSSVHPCGIQLPDWKEGISAFTNHLARSRR